MFDFSKGYWLNQPLNSNVTNENISITTQPNTDFWQRTYYGFQNDNAPALLVKSNEMFFSFTVKTSFNSTKQFDQCGVIIYQDSDNWFKASIEYENEHIARLGSVVTNRGYSDWATTDIDANINQMYYRLSRRNSDYLIENSKDGIVYKQMRIFHLFEGSGEINFGVYACSPSDSEFEAIFMQMDLSECMWKGHEKN